ncbi:hypothetical protein ACOME3_000679 [Neoechinorhynchus agilis]
MIKTIGWIGTGVMGRWMCQHMIEKTAFAEIGKSMQFLVYNRTPSKAEPLLQDSRVKFSEINEIGTKCDLVFLMLGYPRDVTACGDISADWFVEVKIYLMKTRSQIYCHLINDIVFGSSERKGLLDLMKPKARIVDHTTSSAELALKIYEAAKQNGIRTLDGPVSGGDIGARAGKLVCMVGGDKELFDEVSAFIGMYTSSVRLMGKPGCGQQTKAANQIMIASAMVGVCEGLIYGYKAGLNLNDLIDLLKNGAAGSFSLSTYGPRILDRNFEPGFYVHHFVKDLKIAIDEASQMKLSLPGLALAHQLYASVVANGHGLCGTQALMLALETMNNVKVE